MVVFVQFFVFFLFSSTSFEHLKVRIKLWHNLKRFDHPIIFGFIERLTATVKFLEFLFANRLQYEIILFYIENLEKKKAVRRRKIERRWKLVLWFENNNNKIRMNCWNHCLRDGGAHNIYRKSIDNGNLKLFEFLYCWTAYCSSSARAHHLRKHIKKKTRGKCVICQA